MGSQATRPWLVWTVTAIVALSLILVIFNAVWASSNRSTQAANQSAQATVFRRQQEINQANLWSRVERNMTQALVNGAVNHRDEDVKALLQKYNFTITNWPAATAPAPAKPATPATGGAR